MGLAPYNTFTFDGKSSADFGVYLTGEGVFNAPERAVEMLSIPGRNGDYALDLGRFENISVTYKVGMYDVNESNFATKVSNFRNWLCSKVGYVRLTDTYNTGEYRMAVYKSGLELEHELLIAGEAEITFDCKPQRFLTSGETATSVASGGTLSNPTLFDSKPLLECKGHGNILVRGVPITIAYVPMGNILLANGKTFSVSNASTTAIHTPALIGSISLDVSNVNTGDDIYVSPSTLTYNVYLNNRVGWTFDSTSATNGTGESWTTKTKIVSPASAYFTTNISAQTFKKGTSATKTYEYTFGWSAENGSVTYGSTQTIQIKYDGNSTVSLYASTMANDNTTTYEVVGFIGQINAYSTVITNKTFYIDLDLGEAYFIDNNNYVSANYAVSIPAKMPTLRPGNNTITYDNTITNFKATPRWWRV